MRNNKAAQRVSWAATAAVWSYSLIIGILGVKLINSADGVAVPAPVVSHYYHGRFRAVGFGNVRKLFNQSSNRHCGGGLHLLG
jgi:hypothetical protein